MTKQDKKFIGLTILYMIVCVVRYFEHILSVANSCVYIISYKYGFTSRGLIGSLWMKLDQLLPFDLITYRAEYLLCIMLTGIFLCIVLLFEVVCLKQMSEEYKSNAYILIFIFEMITVPMFLTMENFGRIDIFLIGISIICIFTIIYEKAEWLIIPLCIVAMLIHQGFVFTNVNIILVLLIYKGFMSEGKTRKKYFVLFVLTFVTVSVLFLYFEIFRTTHDVSVYNELVDLNKKVSPDGNYYKELLQHEILGVDVRGIETRFHTINMEELPITLLAFVPFIIVIVQFFRGLWQRATNTQEKWAYFCVIGGAVTLIPEWLLKVDFGRYVYAVAFYYIAIILCLMMITNGRDKIYQQLNATLEYVKSKTIMPYLLVVYLAVFMPFRDFSISNTIMNVLKIVGLQ